MTLVREFDVCDLEPSTQNKAAPLFIVPRGRNYTGGGRFIGALAEWEMLHEEKARRPLLTFVFRGAP